MTAEHKHEHIVDADGVDITTGIAVRCGEAVGRVIEITDIDGDVDDYGRSVVYMPAVIVAFQTEDEDSEEVDSFVTHWLGRHMDDDAPFQTDDLTVYKGE